jgi:hypothetical protein
MVVDRHGEQTDSGETSNRQGDQSPYGASAACKEQDYAEDLEELHLFLIGDSKARFRPLRLR